MYFRGTAGPHAWVVPCTPVCRARIRIVPQRTALSFGRLWTPPVGRVGPVVASRETETESERARGRRKRQRGRSAFHYQRGRLSDCQCLACCCSAWDLGTLGTVGPEHQSFITPGPLLPSSPQSLQLRIPGLLSLKPQSPSIWTGRGQDPAHLRPATCNDLEAGGRT